MSEGSPQQEKFRAAVVGWLERNTINFYVITAVLYALMIPASLWVFPSTTLLVTIIVLFSGLISSLGALAGILIDLKQNDDIDDLQDDVDDIQDDV